MISRRCLICAAINPCSEHSQEDQRVELARNDAAIAKLKACDHDYKYCQEYKASMGCVIYRCTKCGDEYEKDVS